MAYKYKNFTDRTDEGLMKGFTGAIPSNRSTEGYKSSANSPDPRKMNWNVNPTVHNSSITKKDDTSLSQISGLSKEPYTHRNMVTLTGEDDTSPKANETTSPTMSGTTQAETLPTVSPTVSAAMAKLEELRKQTYTDPYGDQLDQMIAEFQQKKPFEYQLNADQLYLNARDQYMAQGQKAMRDAMGQATMMTGGYGNTYASQIGNQAYQAYLQELNNSIPNFYSAALDRYNAETANELEKINLINTQRQNDYAMWEEQYLRDLNSALTDIELQQNADNLKLQYAQLGLNPDGSPLTYTDENGNIVQMSTNSSDDGKPLSASQYEKALEEYNSGGSQALNVYVAGLKSQGVSDTALEQLHQTIYGQSGYSKTDAALKRQITDGLWKIDNDESGGTNWFWGINHNRNYIDPYTGKSVTTDELIERLMSTGMTEAEAKDFIQKNLPQGSYDTENEGTHAKQKE